MMPKQSINKKEEIQELINHNLASRDYFYSKADERWLCWLSKNGFLDEIKKEPGERSDVGVPEAQYLERMSKLSPEKVSDIILSFSLKDVRNPNIIMIFLKIFGEMKPEYLPKIVRKIKDEKWISLCDDIIFDKLSYTGSSDEVLIFNEFTRKIFENLKSKKDYKSILTLAEAVLEVRTNERTEGLSMPSPFYIDDLPANVFECLKNVSDEYAEESFKLVTELIKKTIQAVCKKDKTKTFDYLDELLFYKLDFFNLSNVKPKGNVCNLMAVIITLAKRLIGNKRSQTDCIKRLYEKYIDPLPSSQGMYRLKLLIWSLRPELFKEQLKTEFFQLSKFEKTRAPEYERALEKTFSIFSESEKRRYVSEVIKHHKDKNHSSIPCGSGIFSMISAQLTPEDKQDAEKAGFKIDPDYKPQPPSFIEHPSVITPEAPITEDLKRGVTVE